MRIHHKPVSATRALLLVAALSPAWVACGTGTSIPEPEIPEPEIIIVPSTVTVSALAATPAVVAPGGSVVLEASATDSADGDLTYAWSAPSGALSAATGTSVIWTAPLTIGSVVIELVVTSGHGSFAVGAASVLVTTNPSGSSVTISSATATPMAVLPNGAVELVAAAVDSAGGSLTYAWSAASGSLSAALGAAVTWTAPGATGAYPIQLVVTSSSGAVGSSILGVVVSDNPGGGAIVLTSIDAAPEVVLPGGSVTLSAIATYSGAGTPTYTWSVADGTLDATTGNPVTWTAPTTLGAHLVTLSVSDGLGASATGARGIFVNPYPGGAMITGVIPSEARRGDTIIVLGSGFGASQGTSVLTISGVEAAVESWSATEIHAVVPLNATTGDVQIQAASGPSSPGFLLVLWPERDPVNVPVIPGRGKVTDFQLLADGGGGTVVTWDDGGDIFAQRVDAAGTPLWGPSGVVICGAVGLQSDPQLVTDGASGAIITWTDLRDGVEDVYAQRVDTDGVLRWPRDGIVVIAAAGSQEAPAIVADGSGGAIIAWEDGRTATTRVYAQRVDAAGLTHWPTYGVVVSAATGSQTTPRLASDGAAGAIVTWREATGIFGQRLDGAGAPQWTVDGVGLCTAGSSEQEPLIVADGSGGAYVSWLDYRNANFDIYAQRVDPDGAVQWAADGLAVCTASRQQWRVQVATDADGLIVTWQDERSLLGTQVYVQRLAPDGSSAWTADGLAVASGAFPDVASDGSGGAIVVWHDGSTVRAQRINGMGTALWTAGGDVIATGGAMTRLIAQDTGGVLVAWLGDAGSLDTVTVQEVSGAGALAWDPDGVHVFTPSGAYTVPAVISDGDGGIIVAWEDTRAAPRDVYAQRLDANGTPRWTPTGLLIQPGAGGVRLVSDLQGGAIIIWGAATDLYARRIGADGSPLWAADVPLSLAPNGQGQAEIAADGVGGAIVTWSDGRDGNSDIYAQRVDPLGVVQWTLDGVALCTDAATQNGPRVVGDGAGGAIVVWSDQRAGNQDLYAQRVDAAGAIQWAADGAVISAVAGAQEYHQIISDGAGGAILSWRDQRAGSRAYVQRVSDAGVSLWAPDGIPVSASTGLQQIPAIAPDGAGGAFVAWSEDRTGLDRVYAQRLDADGLPQWPLFDEPLVLGPITAHQAGVAIAPDGAGGAIVTWDDLRSGNQDVYAQRVDSTGRIVWAERGTPVCTAPGIQRGGQVVAAAAGGYIVTWFDHRGGTDAGIYSQFLSPTGAQ